MTIVDALGNELNKGDLVCLIQGNQRLFGTIAEIHEPSILAPGKDQMQLPGTVRVALMPMDILYNRLNPHLTDVIKVVKPPNFGKQES